MEKKRGEKQLWLIIAGLILLNCLTVAFFLTKEGSGGREVVATVGKKDITRQDLLHILEERYGENLLKDLINQEVIETLAKKYKVQISDAAVEREMLLIKTMYGTTSHDSASEASFRRQIEISLILEEILTKDVLVPEEELKAYYDENHSLYEIPTSYHVSQIIVKTLDEAKRVSQELEDGSNFAALAMEKSIDELSAAHGGDIGVIQEGDSTFSDDYWESVRSLQPNEWSGPIKVEEGYAIVMLHEVIEGKSYPFEEMKNEIRRLIALEQMEDRSSVESFWDEVDVQWLYGDNNKD